MKNTNCDKMIIAIIQNDDYREVVADLNEHGFYVTVLQSSGGFLKRPSATIMIGLNHEYLDEVLQLLKRYGKRTEMEIKAVTPTMDAVHALPINSVTVPVNCGGIVLFILDVAQYERY